MTNYIKRAADYTKEMFEGKKQYKEFKKQKAKLPSKYFQAFDALEKYMWNFAGGNDFQFVLDDLLQLFEESAYEGVPVKEIIGEDPVEFVTNFMAQYPEEQWLIKMQNKLRKEIEGIEE